MKRDGKALIDLEDGLSSGSVVLVGVADDDFHFVRHVFPILFKILPRALQMLKVPTCLTSMHVEIFVEPQPCF